MKAIRLLEPGVVELTELPVPFLGPGELLLEMRACGLCGSDLGKIFGGTPLKLPVPLGHELVGVVKAIGEGVQRFAIGDRLAVAHHVPCGRCRYCRHGNDSMCPQFKATNIDPGGFAEYVRIPAFQVAQASFTLPDLLPDDVGIFMEPLACALRAVKRSNVQAGDQIVVVGAGCMGLLVAQTVAVFGARPVCVDIREERLELARMLGIETTLNVAGSDPRRALRSVREEDGIDGAILTAVSASMVEAALSVLRAGGMINLFADAGAAGRMAIDLGVFYRQELSLTATYSSTPADLKEAIRLLASGQIRTDLFISHRFDLSRFAEGARLQREGQATKVVFYANGTGAA
ncbi:MAG: alcohol dehydrogenase catalytic domain-containing protein [candidate division NC10 bacterium]|nr:alcohol dehydrogenase catalytic domain-containing protein [candidate division NC10 bacterium]MDE2321457.1 alcohol dehydrogenase catalytic domain-containing protein [candidate division NC10 bacterium]